VEKYAYYGKRFSHKKRMSTIQMGCFLKQQFVMRVLLKLNFTKSQLLLRDIDCLFLFRSVQKLRVYSVHTVFIVRFLFCVFDLHSEFCCVGAWWGLELKSI
jgi:hypothetical protein